MIAPVRLALVFAGALLAASCSMFEPCPPVPPARLPDGSPPGGYARSVDGEARVAIWRSGDSFVVQRILSSTASGEPHCPAGEIAGPGGCFEPGPIRLRGAPAVLLPVGDAEETEWILGWSSGSCRYEAIFGPLDRAEAEAYAAGY